MDLLTTLPTHTIVFLIVVLFATAAFFLPKYDHLAIEWGPSFLTMLGIGGCFYGITVGLLDFDPNNVQESVPLLLVGIKTSFIVSLAGVLGALVIKTKVLFFSEPKESYDGNVKGASIDDLVNHLRQLHDAIAGKESSTLIGQVKLHRQDSNDRLNQIGISLNSYLEKMAEFNSKALIQALQEVIRDFNAKINEQFGENFKQLNSSVEKILVWQEQYRNQVTEMIDQQKSTSKNMTEATLRYGQLVEKAGIFVSVAEKLDVSLTGLETQRQNLEGGLRLLGDLLTKASSSLPEIETKIVEMTKQIESGVRTNNDQIGATIKAITASLQSSQAEMKKLLTDTMLETNKDLNAHIKKMSENTNQQVSALDLALSKELEKSLTSLGTQLAALSEKFVADYTPLTEKLRQVVSIGRGL
jgi:DNA anti-recombination protein RmuC